jgi:hypothetical protein
VSTRIGAAVTRIQREFLKQIAVDLRSLGHQLEYKERNRQRVKLGWLSGGLRQHETEHEISPATDSQLADSATKGLHNGLRALTIDTRSADFKKIEKSYVRQANCSAGDLKLAEIKPSLQVVTLSSNDDLLRYVRLYQNIRSGIGVGKQVVGLVRNGGHSNSPLMGVVAVGLPQYFQGERDFFFGWPNPAIAPRTRGIREAGLNQIGQLVLFVALPPYDRLGVGRILAPLPFTADFAATFEKIRGHSMLGIVCTAGLGEHVPALRRHWVRDLVDEPNVTDDQVELYRRLSGLAKKRVRVFEISSERTRALATAVVRDSRTKRSQSPRRSQWEHDLSTAMRIVAIPLSLFDANYVATYYGSLSAAHDDALRLGSESPKIDCLSFERIVGRWREFAIEKFGSDAVLRVGKTEDLLVSVRVARQRRKLLPKGRRSSKQRQLASTQSSSTTQSSSISRSKLPNRRGAARSKGERPIPEEGLK